jgi:hypothetical protein
VAAVENVCRKVERDAIVAGEKCEAVELAACFGSVLEVA